MMQCDHNKDGQFADETDDTKPGQRCQNEADVLVVSEAKEGPRSTLLCSEAPEHLMLLDDELSASGIPFRVFQLVDVTEAVNNERPVRIEVERDDDSILAITWTHLDSEPMVRRVTPTN